MHPIILSTDLGDVEYRQVDVGEDAKLAQYWGIRGVPTMLVLDENGEELRRHTGMLTPVGLQSLVGYSPEDTEVIELKEPWKETW